MGMKTMKSAKKSAMKVMKKAKPAMKSMKKKVTGSRSSVFKGVRVKTTGGLKKSDLMKSKSGKIVSSKSHRAGLKAYKHIRAWTQAVNKARTALKVKGFVAVKKGSPLYKKAKEFYGK